MKWQNTSVCLKEQRLPPSIDQKLKSFYDKITVENICGSQPTISKVGKGNERLREVELCLIEQEDSLSVNYGVFINGRCL